MNIPFENIFNENMVGKASSEKPDLTGLSGNRRKRKEVALLGIDFQNDFLEQGNLPVTGSFLDVKNIARFIYQHAGDIDDIFMSLDVHQPLQIFHPAWWIDENGVNPKPFSTITYEETLHGTWTPVYRKQESIEYLLGLETLGKKSLIIWNYHCLQGTFGAAIETQLSNMLLAYSLYKEQDVKYLTKGLNAISEMYGIIKPEYTKEEVTNRTLVNELKQYKTIIVSGEAKSHCVLESIKQLVEEFNKLGHTNYKIYVLEDCTSSIPGFEETTELEYKELSSKYPVVLTITTEVMKLI